MSVPSRNNAGSASKPKSQLGRRSLSRRPSFNPNESKLETICEGGSRGNTPEACRERGLDIGVGDVSVNQSKSFLSTTDSLMDYSTLAEPLKLDVSLQTAGNQSTPPFVLRQRLKNKTEILNEIKEELNELSEFTKLERQVLSVEGLTEAIEENKSLKFQIERQSEEVVQLREELASCQARTSQLEKQSDTSRAVWASKELENTSSLQEAWDKLSSLQGDSEANTCRQQSRTPSNLSGEHCSEEEFNNERLKNLELFETSTREFLVLLMKQLNSECDASTSQECMRGIVAKEVADLLNQVESLRKKSEMDSSLISEKTVEILTMSQNIKMLEDLYSYDVDLLSHDHDVKIHHLEDEVERLKTDSKGMKNQLNLARTEITALNEYIAALTCQLEEKSLDCKNKCSELVEANLNIKKFERYCSRVYDMYETNVADLMEEKERLSDCLSKEMRESSERVAELEADWSRLEEQQRQLEEEVGALLGCRETSSWPRLLGDLKQQVEHLTHLVEHLHNQLDSSNQQLSAVTHNNTVLQEKLEALRHAGHQEESLQKQVRLAEQSKDQLERAYTVKINALTLLNDNHIKNSVFAEEELTDKIASLDSLRLSYSEMMNTLGWERDLVIHQLGDLVAYNRNQTNPIEALVPLIKDKLVSQNELVEHMKNKIHSKEDQLISVASLNQQLRCSVATLKGETASKDAVLEDSILVIAEQKELIQSLLSQLEESKHSNEELRTSNSGLLNCKELVVTLSDRVTILEATVSRGNTLDSLLRAELEGFDFASDEELVVAVRNLLDGQRDLIEHLRNQVMSSKEYSSVLGNQYASHLQGIKTEADCLRSQLSNFATLKTDFIASLTAKLQVNFSPTDRDVIDHRILVAVDELIGQCTSYREESEHYQQLVAEKTNEVERLTSETKVLQESLNQELECLAEEGTARVAALHRQIELLNTHTQQLEGKVKSQASRIQLLNADIAMVQTELHSNLLEMNSIRVTENENLCRTFINELSGFLQLDNSENFDCLTSLVKTELNRLVDLVEHLRNQLDSKKSQLNQLRGWNQDLASNLSRVQAEVLEIKACDRESVQVIQEQKCLIDDLIVKLQNSERNKACVDEQVVLLQSLEGRTSSLSDRLSSLEGEHSNCSEVLSHLLSDKQLLIEELSHFIEADSLHQHGIASAVKSELSDLHELLEHLRNKLISKDEQLERLVVKQSHLLDCHASLEAQVLEKNLLIGELNCKMTELEDLRCQMCLADEEKLSLQSKVEQLQERLVDYDKCHELTEHMRNKLKSREDQIDCLTESKQSLEEYIHLLEINASVRENDIFEKLSLQSKVEQLQERLVDYDKCHELAEHMRNKLKSKEDQIDCLTESKQSLEEYIHTLERNASVRENDIFELRENLSESSEKLKKLNQMESDNLVMKQQISLLQEEIVKYTNSQLLVNNNSVKEDQIRGFLCGLQAVLNIEVDSSLVLEEAMQTITEATNKSVKFSNTLSVLFENNQTDLIAKTELINQLENELKQLQDIHSHEIDLITDENLLTCQSLDADVVHLENENARLIETLEAHSARIENDEGLIALLSCELDDGRLRQEVDNAKLKLAQQDLDNQELIEHMRNKQQSKDQLISSLQTKIKTLLASLSYVESQLSDKNSSIQEMEIKLNKLDGLKSDLDCAVTENLFLKCTTAELKEKLSNLEQLTEHLRNSQQSKEQQLMVAKASNDRLTESLALLEIDVNDKQLKINDLNMKITCGELDEIKSLRNEKLLLVQEVQSLQEQLSVLNGLKSSVLELNQSLKIKVEDIALLTEAKESALKSLSLTEEELLRKTTLIEELRSTQRQETALEQVFSSFIFMLTDSLGLDVQCCTREETMSVVHQKLSSLVENCEILNCECNKYDSLLSDKTAEVEDLKAQLTQLDEWCKFKIEEAMSCNRMQVSSLLAEVKSMKNKECTLMGSIQDQTNGIANQDCPIAVLRTEFSELFEQIEKLLNEKGDAAREMLALQREVDQLKCSHSAVEAELCQTSLALKELSLQFKEMQLSSNEAIENLNFEKNLLLETLASEKSITGKCNSFIESLVEDCCRRLQFRNDTMSELVKEMDLCEDLEELKEEVKELRVSLRQELDEVSESSEELLAVQASLELGAEGVTLDLDSLHQHQAIDHRSISHFLHLFTRLVNSNLTHISYLHTEHSLYLSDTQTDFHSLKHDVFDLRSEFSNLVKGLYSQMVLDEFFKHFEEVREQETASSDNVDNSAEVVENTDDTENISDVANEAGLNLFDEYDVCKKKFLPIAANPVDDTLIMTVDCDDSLNLTRTQNHLDLSCFSADSTGTLEPELEATVSEDPFKSVVCNRTFASNLDMTIHLLGQMDESRISPCKKNTCYDYFRTPTEPAVLFAEVKRVLLGFKCLNITDDESVVEELRGFVSSLESSLTLARPFVSSDLSDNSTVSLIRSLCAEVLALRKKISSFDCGKLESLKASCEQLKLDRQHVSAQMRLFQDNFPNQLGDVLNTFLYLSQDLKSSQFNRGKLDSELHDIKEKERKLNEAVALYEKEAQLMSSEIYTLKSEMGVAASELDSFKMSCHDLNSENINLRSEVEGLKEQMTQKEVCSSEAIDSLRVSLSLSTAEKEKLMSEIEALRVENNRKDISLSESLSRNSQVISELESVKGCKDKLNELDKCYVLLEEEKEGLRTRILSLQDTLHENETHLKDYNSLKSDLFSLVSFIKETVSNMTDVSKLKSFNHHFGKSFIYDRNDWAAGIKYISEQQVSLRSLLEDLIKESVEENEAENLQVKSLQSQLQVRISELEDVTTKYDSLQREYIKLNETIKTGYNSSSASVAPELATILSILDCDDQFDQSIGFDHVFSKIRKRIELLKEVCEAKKQSQEGASHSDDLRSSLTRLESELKESRKFKFTFAQEVHSLKPEVPIEQLMLLSLEEMLTTLVTEIMLKEHTIIANLKESHETNVTNYQEKLKQVEREYSLKVEWSNEVEGENDRLNREVKELKEKLETKCAVEGLLEAELDTLEQRLSGSEDPSAVSSPQHNPSNLLTRIRALTKSVPVPLSMTHSQTNYLDLEAKVETQSEQIKLLKSDLQEAESRLEEFTEKMKQLEDCKMKYKEILSEEKGQLDSLVKENNTLKSVIEEKVISVDKLRLQLEEVEELLRTEKLNHKNDTLALNNKIASLEEQLANVSSLLAQSSSNEQKCTELSSQVEKLTMEISLLQSNHEKDLEHQKVLFSSKLRQSADVCASLKRHNFDFQANIKTLEDKLKETKVKHFEESENLRHQLSRVTEKNEFLLNELTVSRSNESQRILLEKEKKQLEEYSNQLKRKIKALEDEVTQKESLHYQEVTRLNKEVSCLTQEIARLSAEIEMHTRKATEAIEGVETLRQEVVKVCPEFTGGELKDFIMEKLQELTEEKQKSKNLDEECDFINNLRQQSDKYLDQVCEEKAEVTKELKSLQADNKSQNILICSLGEEIKMLKAKIEEANTTEQTLLQQINKGGEQDDQLWLTVSRLEAKIKEEDAKLREANAKLKEMDANLKEMDAKLKETDAKLKEAENRNVELSGRLKSHCVWDVQDENRPLNESPRGLTYQSVLRSHNQEASKEQAQKILQQEERIKKLEKDREILKRLCEHRYKTIQQLRSKP